MKELGLWASRRLARGGAGGAPNAVFRGVAGPERWTGNGKTTGHERQNARSGLGSCTSNSIPATGERIK